MLRRHTLMLTATLVVLGGVMWIGSVGSKGAQAKTSRRDAPGASSGFAGRPRLLLAKVIYAVPGVEINVYFDNAVLVVNPANYVFDVTCSKGSQRSDRWTYTPSVKDLGDHRFKIDVRDESNAVIASAETTLRVVPADAGADRPITLLCIGDSLTHGPYTQLLLDRCSVAGNPKLTLIGTRGPGSSLVLGKNRFEAGGGYTARRFVTLYTGIARKGPYAKRGSPFLYKGNDGKPELDFVAYCRDVNQGKGPDFVTIFLGTNDIFSAVDKTIDKRVDNMFRDYDKLLQMIHTVRKDTQIGVVLPVPASAKQDGFGVNYKCGQTRWQYKRNQHRLAERMMEHYGNRGHENIWLVPANLSIDCVKNYSLVNAAHPVMGGYLQIGDSIYCWMKARMAKPGVGQ